jgi:hypothetical protein
MADIFSISGSFFGTASWNDPSIWYGGIVPTSSDRVFVRGILKDIYGTSNDTNWQSGQYNNYLQYWPGTMSALLLGDNFNLPPSGSIYTYTDRNVEVKIDYNGTSGSRAILNCVIDKQYSAPWGQVPAGAYNSNTELPFPDKRGGHIPYRALTIYRPGIIAISGSQTGSAFQLIIEDGGQVRVNGLGQLFVTNYTDVQEGTLELRDYASYRWNPQYTSSASLTVQPAFDFSQASYLNISNNQFSKIIAEGAEVRTNTTLSLASNVGDHYLSVVDATSFEAGDWIFVGDENINTTREDDNTFAIMGAGGGTVFPINGLFTNNGTQYGYTVPSDDECFYIVAKDTGSTPNRLYIERMNALESKILLTASATELVVDEERYQVGDKVLVGTQYRTVTAVEDYDLLLKDYDFLNPTASLSDWETDGTRSPNLTGWGIVPGYGLTITAPPSSSNTIDRLPRFTFIKNLMLTRVKVEAWMQNNIPFSGGLSPLGYRDGNSFGIISHQDPLQDYTAWNYDAGFGGFSQNRTMLIVAPSSSGAYLVNNNRGTSWIQKPILAGIQDMGGLHKLTVETYKGFTKGYIDDIKLFEDVNINGVFWGRVGLFSQNYRVICTRFKVYNKCQKITLDSSVTASIGQIIYESGVEYEHSMGAKVIKLASVVNTVPEELKNKAFAYQGAEEYENNGIFPYVWSINNDGPNPPVGGYNPIPWLTGKGGATQFVGTFSRNGNLLSDQAGGVILDPNYTTFGRPFSASFTVDLTTTMSFNNFGIVDYLITRGQTFTSSVGGGISLSGSNDPTGQIWTPITGGIIDSRGRHDYQSIRDWDLPTTQSFRLLRFQFNHITNAIQFHNKITAFVLRSGSAFNQITLNNTSDLNVGDKIGITPNKSAGEPTNQRPALDQWFFSGSTSLLNGTYEDFFTITAKTGNTLTLNRRIPFLIKKGTQVFKLNRNVNFMGSYATGSGIKTGRIWGNHSNNFCNAFIFKNVGFQHISDGYPYFARQEYGQFPFTYANFWNPGIFQGCSFYNHLSFGGTAWQTAGAKLHFHIRNNVMFPAYYLDGMKPFNQQQGNSSLPYIITGNAWVGGGGSYMQENHSTVINSYNIFYTVDDTPGPLFSTALQYTSRFFGATTKIERNTYKQCYTPLSTGTVGTYSDRILANLTTTIVRNNKIESIATYPYAGTQQNNYIIGIGGSMFPSLGQNSYFWNNVNENMLLPDRGGFDGNQPSAGSQLGMIYYQNGMNPFGTPMKNFNKYGYDVYTSAAGWVIKYPEDSFYRFYNYSASLYYGNNSSLYKLPFMSSQLNITDNTTASFTLGFDYYHDMTQYINQWGGFTIDENKGFIQYDFIPQTGGLAPYTFSQSIFIPTSQSFAGSLAVSVYKNGKLVKPTTKIKKTLTPTNYTETFLLEGKGIYTIFLGQDFAPQGYVSLRNITSTIDCPLTSSVDIRYNHFNMDYFNGLNALTQRNKNNQYSNTGGKFRLKGARMF